MLFLTVYLQEECKREEMEDAMQIFHYGNLSASTVLIQPVDDHDLEEMYLDSFLTIASLDDEGDITKAIEKLDIISEKFKVKFILSVSRNIDKLPECAKAKVIISL